MIVEDKTGASGAAASQGTHADNMSLADHLWYAANIEFPEASDQVTVCA